MGRHWVMGNGGRPLEQSPNASAKQSGHVEDKQWIAVNHFPGRIPGVRRGGSRRRGGGSRCEPREPRSVFGAGYGAKT
jgi:hypothetical protein